MRPGIDSPLTEAGVVLGVDTRLDVHVAVALDRVGRRLAACKHPTCFDSYAEASP